MSAQTVRIAFAVFNSEGDPEIVRLGITCDSSNTTKSAIDDNLATAGYAMMLAQQPGLIIVVP
jgi:hypothetical protein